MHKGDDYEPLTFSKIKALQEPSDRAGWEGRYTTLTLQCFKALVDGEVATAFVSNLQHIVQGRLHTVVRFLVG